jgi:hypothetical protein
MRITKSLILAATLPLSSCQTIDFLTDNCTSEFLRVAWTAPITRGGVTNTVLLSGSVAPGNIDPTQFTILKELLATGGREIAANVIWSVPAFDINGGFIALMHPAPMSTGQVHPVNLAFDGGGWGIVPSNREFATVVSVRANNFLATTATGSIKANNGIPLRLQMDITARSASGETIHLGGEAIFSYQEVGTNCS